MVRHTLLIVLMAFVPILVSNTTSWAQPDDAFTIAVWQAPSRCHTAEHFSALVRDTLGVSDPSNAYGDPVSVSILVEQKGRMLHLRLTTKNSEGEGQRTLQGRNCSELLASAAVVLGLSLAPSLLFQNESEEVVLVSQDPLSEGPIVQKTKSVGRQKDDSETPNLVPRIDDDKIRIGKLGSAVHRRPRVSLHMGFISDIGTLPRPGLGLSLEASSQGPNIRITLRLTRWAEQEEFLAGNDNRKGGRFDFLESSLILCHRLWRNMGACASASVGRLSANAIDIDEPVGQVHPMANIGGGVYAMSLPLGRWRIRVHADLLAQLIVPRYTIGVLEEGSQNTLVDTLLHSPSQLVTRFSGSVGANF